MLSVTEPQLGETNLSASVTLLALFLFFTAGCAVAVDIAVELENVNCLFLTDVGCLRRPGSNHPVRGACLQGVARVSKAA